MQPEAVYDFTDEAGNVLYQEVRLPGKRIFYRRPDGRDGWINNLDGVRLVPYNLHHLVKSTEPILWVEGPKDAETLIKRGFCATTGAHGANGWRAEYAQYFRGRTIYGLRDNDEAGLKLRESMERDTTPVAKSVYRVELPGLAEKEDVTDWFNKGHTLNELVTILDEASKTTVSLPAPVSPEPTSPPARAREEARADLTAEGVLPPFPEAAWVAPFAKYRELVGPTTEAPDSLHWATLYVTLGLCIGRDHYLMSPHHLYGNEFVLVVGTSGDVRKSTALEYGQSLWPHLGRDIQLASGILSAEGIYDALAEQEATRLLICEDEVRTLFAAAARPGTRNLLGELCKLYRCPKEAKLTRRQSTVAKLPFVSLIGATTPEWISTGLEEEAVFGGFFNRCLVITGAPKPYVPHPAPPPVEALRGFVEPLQHLIVKLSERPGPIAFDRAAYERWGAWYVAWRGRRKEWPLERQVLTRRTEDHVRKVALVYACARSHDAITLDDLERAIQIGEHCESLSLRLFGGLTLPRQTRLEERILSCVPQAGMKWRDLLARIGGKYKREEVARAVQVLEETGEIEMVASDAIRGPKGRLIRRLEGRFEEETTSSTSSAAVRF